MKDATQPVELNSNQQSLVAIFLPLLPVIPSLEMRKSQRNITNCFTAQFRTDLRGTSGAIGIAQFEPSTAQGLGIDPHDPIQSLQGAAQLMASYYNTYHSYPMALAAYNAGTGALNTAISNCGLNWEACVPAETRGYIAVIMGGQ